MNTGVSKEVLNTCERVLRAKPLVIVHTEVVETQFKKVGPLLDLSGKQWEGFSVK